MVKNCLQCVHFTRKIFYEYSKNNAIYTANVDYFCNKLNLIINLKKSDEKNNEMKMIPNKCENGKHFEEIKKFDISRNIIWKDV